MSATTGPTVNDVRDLVGEYDPSGVTVTTINEAFPYPSWDTGSTEWMDTGQRAVVILGHVDKLNATFKTKKDGTVVIKFRIKEESK